MKLTRKVLGVAVLLCLLALGAVPASAAPETAGTGEGPSVLLDEIEAAGYDVTYIRAAFEDGDFEDTGTLIHQFIEAHPGEFTPAFDETQSGGESGEGARRRTGMLEKLEDQGYDVTDIRAAFACGDTGAAYTLLQQFMEAHADKFPEEAGDMGGMNHGCREPPEHSQSSESTT